MKLRCIVVDDEKHARAGIVAYVQQVSFLELVGECKSAIEANQLLQKEEVDLLLLDIQMPDLTGIDWLKSLKQIPMVIFITAFREFALDGFELDAVDYLMKPVSFARFLKAVNKAQQQKVQQSSTNTSDKDEHIFVKVDQKLVKVYLRQIRYIEAANDYIFIHTETGRHLTLLSLKQMAAELPEPPFLRVHRSYIVNIQQVEAMEGNLLRIGKEMIPVSRNSQEKAYQLIVGKKLLR